MQTREQIIIAMCKLYKDTHTTLTREENEAVFKLMGQIYDTVIAPNMEFKNA